MVKLNGHERACSWTRCFRHRHQSQSSRKSRADVCVREKYYGLGDKGARSGYSAVAENIRVGDLEFHDCLVDVTDSVSVTSEDGMIGADVFSSYLIDIDIPDMKLRLIAVTEASEGGNAPATLKTQEESESPPRAAKGRRRDSKPTATAAAQDTAQRRPRNTKPMDRYVAPEMARLDAGFSLRS